MATSSEKRVLAIGLDGATFDVVRPMVARGELPALGAMMEAGCQLPLQSTVPPITPPAWSSFSTGTTPAAHGVFGFTYPTPGERSLQLTSAADLRRPALWERLSRAGHRVLLFDVPFTYPPAPVDGCVLAGFPLPEEGEFAQPDDLPDRLREAGVACSRYPTEEPDPTDPEFLRGLDRFNEERIRLFRHLTETEPWRFAMVGTMALDWAQHALWKYFDRWFVFAGEPEADARRETLLEAYRRVDTFVGRLVEIAGEGATIIVLSDHGFGATLHYDWVARALEEVGLLRYRSRPRGVAGRLGAAALNVARSSTRLQRLGKRLLGDAAAARSWARKSRSHSDVDWERTRVFPAGDYNLNLYVNRRSRFRDGLVGESEVDRTVDKAVAALRAYQPPGHDLPLVRRIVRNEEAGSDESGRTPDLSMELTVLPMAAEGEAVGPVAGILGFHSPEGILISNRKEWLGGTAPERMNMAEVAPAILRFFGVPDDPGGDRVGRPPGAGFSQEESKAVFDRLRGLGYLD